MATYYLDDVGGNDSNAGTTFATRWKTFNSGATSARIAAGDTIRVMASPDPTFVGTATFTQSTYASPTATVTLAAAVTATISNCDSVWTPATNVTATADTSVANIKQGTACASLVTAAGFTTGKIAYFATGTLDLSGYQQVSFWFYSNVNVPNASTLSLRLCSDTAGATTVHTIAIPVQAAGGGYWYPVTVDLGANMSSSIQSVALYADATWASSTVRLDNIIACKASSAADSLTLNSLIAKEHILVWAASTAYTAGKIRKPTTVARNGLSYQCTTAGTSGSTEPAWPKQIGATVTDGSATWTCFDLEETWYTVQGLIGTTLTIGSRPSAYFQAQNLRGYAGTTETVALYKREPILRGITSNMAASTSGTDANPILFSGGWSRTDMSTQTGETWYSNLNGQQNGLVNARNYVNFEHFGIVRAANAVQIQSGSNSLNFVHAGASTNGFYIVGVQGTVALTGCQSSNCYSGLEQNLYYNAMRLWYCAFNCAEYRGLNQIGSYRGKVVMNECRVKNCYDTGIYVTDPSVPLELNNVITANNRAFTPNWAISASNIVLSRNCIFNEGEPAPQTAYGSNGLLWYHHNLGQTGSNHVIWGDQGKIRCVTDQRHTTSGYSWKFSPTSNYADSFNPLILSVAKVYCDANVAKAFQIWAYRSSTSIRGRLVIRGLQLAGIPSDVYVQVDPAVTTWTQSSALTVTPTEAGVLEVEFHVFDGVGTSNNYWIDDLSVA